MAYDRLYLDVTVLTNLATADIVGVVPDIVDNPRTAYAVRDELEAELDAGTEELTRALAWIRDPLDGESDPGITVAGSLVRQRKAELFDRLATSEAAVLYQALASESVLATDDCDVRAVADRYGVAVTGSVGIVALAAERGVLSRREADAALATWRAAGDTVPVESVDELLAEG